MTPKLRTVSALGPQGFTEIAYAEWGDADRTVICVHGLTRNARDFDWLAQALVARGWRVLCPDMPGRGRSSWLSDPGDYGYAIYLAASAALIARSAAARVAWVGTSMGGIIGMMLAAQPNTPLQTLVLNDVGALIPAASIARIGSYVGDAPVFSNLDGIESYLRHVHAPFGALTDEQWRHLAVHSAVPAEQGGLRLHYDPAIALPFKQQEPKDVDLWPIWGRVACPTLIVRGASSDLLLADTAREMAGRAKTKDVQLVEFAGCGHAPALMDPAQIAAIADFLERS
ncbi:MAG TPA: alpha/beta hydrolase [Alphaproteobacteria bacterium]|nr:alpha/beta hydrolase [Alphaproteobacteria bacterium]